MVLSQNEIEMGSIELPEGHNACKHVENGEPIAAVCKKPCDRDLCYKCIGAHTCLRHDVEEVVNG